MVRSLFAALAAALTLASLTQAASFPTAGQSFERSLGGFRAEFVKARLSGVAEDLKVSDRNARILAQNAGQLNNVLANLRQRAWARRTHVPPAPDNDPFFGMDLQRFVWSMRDYVRDSRQVQGDVQRL